MDLLRLGHTIKHILNMSKMYEEVCFEGRLLFTVWRKKWILKIESWDLTMAQRLSE